MSLFCPHHGGSARWPIRPDDRWCGLCGRPLIDAMPLGPLLATDAPPPLAVYLDGQGRGRLILELTGLWGARPEVHWAPRTQPALWLTSQEITEGTKLVLNLEADTPSAVQPGPFGRAQLRISVQRHAFDFTVAAFGTEGLTARVRPSVQPGPPFAQRDLVVYRGPDSAKSFLEMDLGGAVPVQWEALSCNHPAATVSPLHADKAAAVVQAVVCWDLTRFRTEGDGEEVRFCLKLRDLPAVDFHQRLWWRLRHPLVCQPTGLMLPALVEERTETHVVRLANADRQPLLLERIHSDVAWLAGDLLQANGPLRLEPGASADVRLELKPQEVNGSKGPYLGRVAFCFKGRGRQLFPVRVETIQRARQLPGPLLVDPGPPRIVAGYHEDDGRFVYTRATGDGGIDPAELGLDPEAYWQTVYDTADEALLLKLLHKVAGRVRTWDQVRARRMLVCRQPWLDQPPRVHGVTWCDWSDLLPQLPNAEGVVRLGAWETYLQESGAEGPLWPPGLVGEVEPLGSVVLGCLPFLPALPHPQPLSPVGARGESQPLAPEGRGEKPAPWLRLAVEALLADYRWGPDYAWRRLLRTWNEYAPAQRLCLDPGAADEQLRRRLTLQADRLVAWLAARPRKPTAVPTYTLVGSVLGSRPLADLVRSAAAGRGVFVECADARWLEWLPVAQPLSTHPERTP
jgi:hypothetical protein